jgi:hypothetical protein
VFGELSFSSQYFSRISIRVTKVVPHLFGPNTAGEGSVLGAHYWDLVPTEAAFPTNVNLFRVVFAVFLSFRIIAGLLYRATAYTS